MDRTHLLQRYAEKSGYDAEKERSNSSLALEKHFLSFMEYFNPGYQQFF